MQQILSAFKRSAKKKRYGDTESLVENMQQENIPAADSLEVPESQNTPLKPTKLLSVLGHSTPLGKAPGTGRRPPSASVLRPSNLQPLDVPDPAGAPVVSKAAPGRPGLAARPATSKPNSFTATPGRTPSRRRELVPPSPQTPMTPGAGTLSTLGSTRKLRTPRPLSASLDGFRAAQLLQQHQQAAGSSGDNVKVLVRVRPLNDREVELGSTVCIQVINGQNMKVLTTPQPHFYTFDAVAGEGVDQQSVFTAVGRPIVDNCILGYNSCIFAYGQTGSGKTHTMLGSLPASDTSFTEMRPDDEQRGLIPRVFETLFARILQEQQQTEDGCTVKYTCKCSFLEIYNENITDLLTPSDAHLHIREDAKHGVYVENLSEEVVFSAGDTARLLAQGAAARRVGQTHMNRESSRSHTLFVCSLEKQTTDGSGLTTMLFSRLNLVDLAGSELQRQSGAQGERLREASSINKSLSTLGRVIMSLVEAQHGQNRHIPYRDSRLTFLLQDSLGGNSKTFMIANVSPAAVNIAETMSTLGFAQRAKRIQNKAVINEDTSGDTQLLRLEIQRLKEELGQVRSQAPAAGPALLPPPATAALWASPSPTPSYQPQSDHAALVGALRREEAAIAASARLRAELAAAQELLREREMDTQRSKMIIRLKDSRIACLEEKRGPGLVPEAELEALRQENELLREKVDNHPEVKRFAVENLHLSSELERMSELVAAGELEALMAEVDGLRAQVLALAQQATRLAATPQVKEVEAAARRAAAENTAQIEAAMVHAEDARRKGAAEMEAQALEVVELRDRVADEAESARELRAKLAAAQAVVHRLEDQNLSLEERLVQLRGECTELRSQLSPMQMHTQRVGEVEEALRAAGLAAEAAAEEARGLRRCCAHQAAMASAETTLRERAEAQISELQGQLEAAQSSHALLQASSEQQAAELAGSLDKVAMLKAALKDTSAQVMEVEQRRHQEEVAGLKEELHAQCSISVQTQAELQAAKANLASARREAKQAASEMQAMQAKLWEAQATVESKHSGVLAAHEAAKQHVVSARQLAAGLHEDVQHKARVITALEADRQALQAAVEQLQQDLTTSQGEVNQLKSQQSSATQQTATAAQAHSAQLQEHTDQLQAQIVSLQQQLEVQAQEHEQALASAAARSVNFCEREFVTLRAQLDAERQAEVASLQQQAQAEADRADALQQQLEEARQLLEALHAKAIKQRQSHADEHQAQQAKADALRQELAELRSSLSHDAEPASLAVADARERIAGLVAEREAWLAELTEQRASANAAADAAEALEARVRQLQASEQALSAQLAEIRQHEGQLEQEVTKLTGQHNHAQRVQHHLKVKEESNALKAELAKLRDDHAKQSTRYSRATAELARYRTAAGKAAEPDLEEEDRLRASLATLEADKLRLGRELEALAHAVLGISGGQGHSATVGGKAAVSGADAGGDIAVPDGQQGAAVSLSAQQPSSVPAADASETAQTSESHASGAAGYLPAAAHESGEPAPGRRATLAGLAQAARSAIEDLKVSWARAQRAQQDQVQQIRMLKEASRLQHMKDTVMQG